MKVQLTEEQRANLTLWIEKLESGEYRQGIGRLRRGMDLPKFCCLGVYAAIKDAEWIRMLPSLVFNDEDWFKEQTGLSYNEQNELAHRNDRGQDFVQIASAIRRYLETGDTDLLKMSDADLLEMSDADLLEIIGSELS